MMTPSPLTTDAWQAVMSAAHDYGLTFTVTKQQLLQAAAGLEKALDTWLASQPGDPKLITALLYELVRRRVGR